MRIVPSAVGTSGDSSSAQLPEVLCAVDVHKGRLRRVLPDWNSAEVPVHVLYSRARHPSPEVFAFLDLVAKELRLRI